MNAQNDSVVFSVLVLNCRLLCRGCGVLEPRPNQCQSPGLQGYWVRGLASEAEFIRSQGCLQPCLPPVTGIFQRRHALYQLHVTICLSVCLSISLSIYGTYIAINQGNCPEVLLVQAQANR